MAAALLSAQRNSWKEGNTSGCVYLLLGPNTARFCFFIFIFFLIRAVANFHSDNVSSPVSPGL